MILAIILYAILGSISGLLAGLLGISGGVVTVPCLFFIFRLLDFPLAFSMQVAIGTSLAAMVFNAFSSTWAHSRKKGVVWDLFKGMLLGIILSSLLGAYFGDLLSSLLLELLFGIFACLLGIQFLHPFFLLKASRQKTPNKVRLSLYGLTIAFISNILGIGGGVITVPTLLYTYSRKTRYRHLCRHRACDYPFWGSFLPLLWLRRSSCALYDRIYLSPCLYNYWINLFYFSYLWSVSN